MRRWNFLLGVSAVVLTSSFGVACATPQEEEVEDQNGAITGGKAEDESPLVFLATTSAGITKPTCVGTMLSETIVVTEKQCANKNLTVKRAARSAKTTAKVKAVHLPTQAGAEIALLELDSPLKGKTAKLASTELAGGYHILGATTFSGGVDDAVIVKGTIGSQTASEGLIVPEKGKQLCDSDVGASVFKKIPSRLLGFLWKRGNWELSGLIVGRGATAPAPAAAPEPPADGTPDPDPEADPNAPPEEPKTAAAEEQAPECSATARRVAPLALYAEFLKKHAPEAFPQPKPEGGGIGSGGGFPFPFPFPGTGGNNSPTAGTLRSCSLVTTTLPPAKVGERTGIIQAKASFANASKDKVIGQFGLATKANPTSLMWSPATALDAMTGSSFDSRFEGGVNAPSTEGEYLIAFRASANGGTTWTECDLDGSENGFSATKTLAFQVTTAAPPAATPAPEPSLPSSPASESTDTSSSNDPSESSPEEDEVPVKKKSKSDDGGCSVSATPGTTSGLPFVGILLGLAALTRRRARR